MITKEKHSENMRTYRKNNPKKAIQSNMDRTMRRQGIDPPEPVVMADILLDTVHIELPQEQMEWLKLNKRMNRKLLFKAFKKQFNRNINKLQFNFNLIKAKFTEPKQPYPRPDIEHTPNLYWVANEGVWDIIFIKNGKKRSLGRYMSHVKAVEIAEEYRNNLA